MENNKKNLKINKLILRSAIGVVGIASLITAAGVGIGYGLKSEKTTNATNSNNSTNLNSNNSTNANSNNSTTSNSNNSIVYISKPQTDQYIFQNGTVDPFTIAAKSSNSSDYLTYQWYKGNSDNKIKIIGATSSSFTPNEVNTSNPTNNSPYNFLCIITSHNNQGKILSNQSLEFSLSVISKPTISFANATYSSNTNTLLSTKQSTNNVVYATINETDFQTINSNAICSDSSIGLTYQWYKSSVNNITSIDKFNSSDLIEGANSSSYTLQSSDVSSTGTTYYYLYAVGNDHGNTFSGLSPAYEVQVENNATITVSYSSTTVYQTAGYAGSTISPSAVNINGNSGNNISNESYQWYTTNPYYDKNATMSISGTTYYEIPGATNQYYNLQNTGKTISGTFYYVLIVVGTENGTSITSITSTNATSAQKVIISDQPTINFTDSNNFSVSGVLYQNSGIVLNPTINVTGVSTTTKDSIGFTYQWYSNTVDSTTNGTKITTSGTGSSYYIQSNQLDANNLYYYVVVTYNVPYTNDDTLTQTSPVYHITLTSSTTPTPSVSNITNTVYAVTGEKQYQTLVSSVGSVANSNSTYQWYTTNPYYSSNTSETLKDGTKVYLIPNATDTTYTLNSNDLIIPKSDTYTQYSYYLAQKTSSTINDVSATTTWSTQPIIVYVSEQPTLNWNPSNTTSATIQATVNQTKPIYQNISATISNASPTDANPRTNLFNDSDIIYSWYKVDSKDFTLPSNPTALQTSNSSTFNYLPYTKTVGTYYFVCIASYNIDGITVSSSQFETTLTVSTAPTITVNILSTNPNQTVYLKQQNTTSIFNVSATLNNGSATNDSSTIGLNYTWYYYFSSTNTAPTSLPTYDSTTNKLTIPTGWSTIANNNSSSYQTSDYSNVGTYYYVVYVTGTTASGINVAAVSSSSMSLTIHNTPTFTSTITPLNAQNGLDISNSSSTTASVYTGYSGNISLNTTPSFTGLITNDNVITTYDWYEEVTTANGKTTTTQLTTNQSYSNYVITTQFSETAGTTYKFYCVINAVIYNAAGAIAINLDSFTSQSYVITTKSVSNSVANVSISIPDTISKYVGAVSQTIYPIVDLSGTGDNYTNNSMSVQYQWQSYNKVTDTTTNKTTYEWEPIDSNTQTQWQNNSSNTFSFTTEGTIEYRVIARIIIDNTTITGSLNSSGEEVQFVSNTMTVTVVGKDTTNPNYDSSKPSSNTNPATAVPVVSVTSSNTNISATVGETVYQTLTSTTVIESNPYDLPVTVSYAWTSTSLGINYTSTTGTYTLTAADVKKPGTYTITLTPTVSANGIELPSNYQPTSITYNITITDVSKLVLNASSFINNNTANNAITIYQNQTVLVPLNVTPTFESSDNSTISNGVSDYGISYKWTQISNSVNTNLNNNSSSYTINNSNSTGLYEYTVTATSVVNGVTLTSNLVTFYADIQLLNNSKTGISGIVTINGSTNASVTISDSATSYNVAPVINIVNNINPEITPTLSYVWSTDSKVTTVNNFIDTINSANNKLGTSNLDMSSTNGFFGTSNNNTTYTITVYATVNGEKVTIGSATLTMKIVSSDTASLPIVTINPNIPTTIHATQDETSYQALSANINITNISDSVPVTISYSFAKEGDSTSVYNNELTVTSDGTIPMSYGLNASDVNTTGTFTYTLTVNYTIFGITTKKTLTYTVIVSAINPLTPTSISSTPSSSTIPGSKITWTSAGSPTKSTNSNGQTVITYTYNTVVNVYYKQTQNLPVLYADVADSSYPLSYSWSGTSATTTPTTTQYQLVPADINKDYFGITITETITSNQGGTIVKANYVYLVAEVSLPTLTLTPVQSTFNTYVGNATNIDLQVTTSWNDTVNTSQLHNGITIDYVWTDPNGNVISDANYPYYQVSYANWDSSSDGDSTLTYNLMAEYYLDGVLVESNTVTFTINILPKSSENSIISASIPTSETAIQNQASSINILPSITGTANGTVTYDWYQVTSTTITKNADGSLSDSDISGKPLAETYNFDLNNFVSSGSKYYVLQITVTKNGFSYYVISNVLTLYVIATGQDSPLNPNSTTSPLNPTNSDSPYNKNSPNYNKADKTNIVSGDTNSPTVSQVPDVTVTVPSSQTFDVLAGQNADLPTLLGTPSITNNSSSYNVNIKYFWTADSSYSDNKLPSSSNFTDNPFYTLTTSDASTTGTYKYYLWYEVLINGSIVYTAKATNYYTVNVVQGSFTISALKNISSAYLNQNTGLTLYSNVSNPNNATLTYTWEYAINDSTTFSPIPTEYIDGSNTNQPFITLNNKIFAIASLTSLNFELVVSAASVNGATIYASGTNSDNTAGTVTNNNEITVKYNTINVTDIQSAISATVTYNKDTWSYLTSNTNKANLIVPNITWKGLTNDSYIVSYAWYESNTSNISTDLSNLTGNISTDYSFAPSITSAGTKYYYLVVELNLNGSTAYYTSSNAVTVTVYDSQKINPGSSTNGSLPYLSVTSSSGEINIYQYNGNTADLTKSSNYILSPTTEPTINYSSSSSDYDASISYVWSATNSKDSSFSISNTNNTNFNYTLLNQDFQTIGNYTYTLTAYLTINGTKESTGVTVATYTVNVTAPTIALNYGTYYTSSNNISITKGSTTQYSLDPTVTTALAPITYSWYESTTANLTSFTDLKAIANTPYYQIDTNQTVGTYYYYVVASYNQNGYYTISNVLSYTVKIIAADTSFDLSATLEKQSYNLIQNTKNSLEINPIIAGSLNNLSNVTYTWKIVDNTTSLTNDEITWTNISNSAAITLSSTDFTSIGSFSLQLSINGDYNGVPFATVILSNGPLVINVVGLTSTNYPKVNVTLNGANSVSSPLYFMNNNEKMYLTSSFEIISNPDNLDVSISYQWYKDGTTSSDAIEGATNSYLLVSDITTPATYYLQYTLTIGGVAQSSEWVKTATTPSENASITVTPYQPVLNVDSNQTNYTYYINGQDNYVQQTNLPDLSVSVKGNVNNIAYQWYTGTYNASLTNGGGTQINGATSSSYQIPVTSTQTSIPNYYVIVSTTINGKTITGYKQFNLTSYIINPSLVWNNPNVLNNSITTYTSQANNPTIDTLINNLPYFISNPKITYTWTETYTDSNNKTTTTTLVNNGASYALPTYATAGTYTYSVSATFDFDGMTFSISTPSGSAFTATVKSVTSNAWDIKISLPTNSNYVSAQTENTTISPTINLSSTPEIPSGATFTYTWYSTTSASVTPSSTTNGTLINNNNSDTYQVATTGLTYDSNGVSTSYIYLVLTIKINNESITEYSNVSTINVYNSTWLNNNITISSSTSYSKNTNVVITGQKYNLPQLSSTVGFSTTYDDTQGISISNISYQWYKDGTSISSATSSYYNLQVSDANTAGTYSYYVEATYTINGVNFSIDTQSKPQSITVSNIQWKAYGIGDGINYGNTYTQNDPLIYWAASDDFSLNNYSPLSPTNYNLYVGQTSNLPMFTTTMYAFVKGTNFLPISLPVTYVWTFTLENSNGTLITSYTQKYENSQMGMMLPEPIYYKMRAGDKVVVSLIANVSGVNGLSQPLGGLGYLGVTSQCVAMNSITFNVQSLSSDLTINTNNATVVNPDFYYSYTNGTLSVQSSNLPTVYINPEITLNGEPINSSVNVTYSWVIASSTINVTKEYSYYQLTENDIKQILYALDYASTPFTLKCTITATYEGARVTSTFISSNITPIQIKSSVLSQVANSIQGQVTYANQYESKFQTFGASYQQNTQQDAPNGIITYSWYNYSSYDTSSQNTIPSGATKLNSSSNFYTLTSNDVQGSGISYYWLVATWTYDGFSVSQTQLFTINVLPYQVLSIAQNSYHQTIYVNSQATNTLSVTISALANSNSSIPNNGPSIMDSLSGSWYYVPTGQTPPSVNHSSLSGSNGMTISNLPNDSYLLGSGFSLQIPSSFVNKVGSYSFYFIAEGVSNGYTAYKISIFQVNVVENTQLQSYITSSNNQSSLNIYNNKTANLPTLTNNIVNIPKDQTFSYEWYYILNNGTTQNTIYTSSSPVLDLNKYTNSITNLLTQGGWIYCVASTTMHDVPLTISSSFEVIPFTLSASITYQYSTSSNALHLYLGQTQNLPSLAPTIVTTLTNKLTGSSKSWNGSLSYQWYEDGNIITTTDNETANSNIYTFNSTYDLTGKPSTNYYSVLVSATINGNTFVISPSVSSTTGSILNTLDTPTITVTNNNNTNGTLNYYFVQNQSTNIPLLTANSSVDSLSNYSLNTDSDYYNITSYTWTVVNTTLNTTKTYTTDSPTFQVVNSSYEILNTVGVYKIYLTVTYNFYGVSASGSSESSPFIVTVSEAPTINLTSNSSQTVSYQSVFNISANVTVSGTSLNNFDNEYSYEIQQYSLNNSVTSISDFSTFDESSFFLWQTIDTGSLTFNANTAGTKSIAQVNYSTSLGISALPVTQYRIVILQANNQNNQVISDVSSIKVNYSNSSSAKQNLNTLMTNPTYDLGMIYSYAKGNINTENSIINLLMPKGVQNKILDYIVSSNWNVSLDSISYSNSSSSLFPTFLMTYTNNTDQEFVTSSGNSSIKIPSGATISFDLPMNFLSSTLSFTNRLNQTFDINQTINISSNSSTALSWSYPSNYSLDNSALSYSITYNNTSLVPNNSYWEYPNLSNIIFSNLNTSITSNKLSWSWVPVYDIS